MSTGGWALVFAVEDINTGKEYALKVNISMRRARDSTVTCAMIAETDRGGRGC